MIQSQNKIFSLKNPAFLAFVTALCAGLLVHQFALSNPLHNYDDIAVQPFGFGTGISSGRWLLEVLGRTAFHLAVGYNAAPANGLIFLFWLALSAGFLVSALGLRNRSFAALIGILFVVFPSAVSTMYFRYTAPYYGFGIFLSVLAAWVLYRSKLGLLYCAILVGCSLGIYQSYAPLTIGIFVLCLLKDTVSGETDFKTLVLRGLYDCAALALGLVAYALLLRVTLFAYQTQLSDYQGIDQMGLMSLPMLPYLVETAFFTVLKLAVQDYCEMASSVALQMAFRLTMVLSVLLTAYLMVFRVRKLLHSAMAAVLLILFPIAAAFVIVMCPQSYIYTLMTYGFVLIPCVPAVLLEALPQSEGRRELLHTWVRKGAALLLAVFLFFYSYNANLGYTALYYANRQAENYYTALVTQVRMTEGFTADKQWAFVGHNQDPLQAFSPWGYLSVYGGSTTGNGLIHGYSGPQWAANYLGYTIPLASEEDIQAVTQTEEFRSMPCWPDEGSIQAIGNMMVIKYSEP